MEQVIKVSPGEEITLPSLNSEIRQAIYLESAAALTRGVNSLVKTWGSRTSGQVTYLMRERMEADTLYITTSLELVSKVLKGLPKSQNAKKEIKSLATSIRSATKSIHYLDGDIHQTTKLPDLVQYIDGVFDRDRACDEINKALPKIKQLVTEISTRLRDLVHKDANDENPLVKIRIKRPTRPDLNPREERYEERRPIVWTTYANYCDAEPIYDPNDGWDQMTSY